MNAPIPTPLTGVTLNLHLTALCNYHCRFCWATFRDVPGALTPAGWLALLARVANERVLLGAYAVDKITFAGGEPTLLPWLPDLIHRAHALGFTTCVVTNASRIDEAWFDAVTPCLDWLTLSLDSGDEGTNVALGRGRGSHVGNVLRAAHLARTRGAPRIRVNTVVTKSNAAEDLTPILDQVRPDRWKVLQATRIEGQNDGSDELFDVSSDEFLAFCARHASHAPVVEPTSTILSSYLMVDPLGRSFNNTAGRHVYGPPILEAGLERSVLEAGWIPEKFVARGGTWPWRLDPTSAADPAPSPSVRGA